MTIMQGLLPNAVQQFLDGNGSPIVAGTVYHYIPGTTTTKLTYIDPEGATPNPNPIILDEDGRAIIYGLGQYRQVLYDQNNVLIWDQLTQGLAPTDAASGSGFGKQEPLESNATTDLGTIHTNNVLITGDTTIASFGASASVNSPIFLIQFEQALTIQASVNILLPSNIDLTVHNGDSFLFSYQGSGIWAFLTSLSDNLPFETVIASAPTVDLGLLPGNLVHITGNVNITSFGLTADKSSGLFYLRFTNTLTVVYDAVNMLIPGARSLAVASGDELVVQPLGSGKWRVVTYTNAFVGALPVGLAKIGAIADLTAAETLYSFTDARFKCAHIWLHGLKASADAKRPLLLLSDDNGATWKVTGYNWATVQAPNASGNALADTAIYLSGVADFDNSGACDFDLRVNFSDSFAQVIWTGGGLIDAGHYAAIAGTGHLNLAANALQIKWSSGTFSGASGTYFVWLMPTT